MKGLSVSDQNKVAASSGKTEGMLYSSAIKDAVFNGVNASDDSSNVGSKNISTAKVGDDTLRNRYEQIRVWSGAKATGYYRLQDGVRATDVGSQEGDGQPFDTKIPLNLNVHDRSQSGAVTYQVFDPSVGGNRQIKIASFLGEIDSHGSKHSMLHPDPIPNKLGQYPLVLSWLSSLSNDIRNRIEEMFGRLEEYSGHSDAMVGREVEGSIHGVHIKGVLTGRYGHGEDRDERYEVKTSDGGMTEINSKTFQGIIGDKSADHAVVEQPGGYVTNVDAEGNEDTAHHSIRDAVEYIPLFAGPHHGKEEVVQELRSNGIKSFHDPMYEEITIRKCTDSALNGKQLSGQYHKTTGVPGDHGPTERIIVGIRGNTAPEVYEEDPKNWVDLSTFTGELIALEDVAQNWYGARYKSGKIVELLGHHPLLMSSGGYQSAGTPGKTEDGNEEEEETPA